LIGVTIIVFIITRLVPGGPLERAMMEAQQLSIGAGGSTSRSSGQNMALSQDQLDRLREYYGFDKPILVSYADWLGKVATGDLGSSYRYNEPVWDVIQQRFPVSLYYGLVTLVITYLVCIPLGVLKAIKHRTIVCLERAVGTVHRSGLSLGAAAAVLSGGQFRAGDAAVEESFDG
jgi:microcin C transport system permease protein